MEKSMEQAILDRAKKYCRDETDLEHLLAALQMAKKILAKERGNSRIIIPAIIMHDLGYHIFSPEEELMARKSETTVEETKLLHKHEQESARLATIILDELAWPEEEKSEIIKIITGHDTRKTASSPEDAIVKDADRLSRYTPKCAHLFAEKFKKNESIFLELLQQGIDKWFYTDTAKYLAREYLLKNTLKISDVEFEKELTGKFYAILIKLQMESEKIARKCFEEIAIRTAREKVCDVKRMIELYLADRAHINVRELQTDAKFLSLAIPQTSIGGYIGLLDRESQTIIFHPDKRVINLSREKLKETHRPTTFLAGFQEWHERAFAGEEFYAYYQGVNSAGKIIDKFVYVMPIDIKNARWAIAAAEDCNDFFRNINILSRDMLAAVGEVAGQIGELVKSHEESQAKLVQTEKFAVVSQIAAEAAHEINNPLTVIRLGLERLQKILTADQESAKKTIVRMNMATDRAISYVQNLLSNTKTITLNRASIKIASIIEQALEELPETLSTNLEIERNFAADLPEINADADQLKKVFANLIKNASEAMNGRGRLSIRSEYLRDERVVLIIFEDTGPGIPAEIIPHIFTPFYTTKSRGTGLGLALCQRIIAAHQGKIELTSEMGKGSRFVVKLKRD